MSATAPTVTADTRSRPAGRPVLHPNYIVRIAGEPASLVSSSTNGEAVAVLDAITQLEAEIAASRQAACDVIEASVPSIEDNDARQAALALKRDLFRLRFPKGKTLRLTEALLSREDWAPVPALLGRLASLKEREESFSDAYERDIAHGERALRALSTRTNISDGLKTVHPRFSGEVERRYANMDGRKTKKNDRSVDNTFLQYFLRASVKTSPLSSFAGILLGSWHDDGVEIPRFDILDFSLQRRVSLRRGLFHEAFGPELRRVPVDPDRTRVSLNGSLRSEGNVFVVNRRIDGASLKGLTWGVGVEEARFAMSPAVAVILNRFGKAGAGGLTINTFLREANVPPGHAKAAALSKAVQDLIAIGALITDHMPLEQEDPLDWAAVRFAAVADDAHKAALEGIDQIRDSLRQSKEVRERHRSEKAIRSVMIEAARRNETVLQDELLSPVIYEDCFLAAPPPRVSARCLKEIRDDLATFLELSPIFDMNAGLQSWLATQFIDEYGPEGACDDPRSFFARRMKGIESGIIAPWTISAVESGCPMAAELKALRTDFMDHVVRASAGQETAYLDREAVRSFAARVPDAVRNRPVSQCFFGQLADAATGRPRFVINQILSGHSQLFARFLDAADDRALSAVHEYLKGGCAWGRYAELSGVFGFNANLHPTFCEEEVLVPPFPANSSRTAHHIFDRMALRYDRRCHRLFLQTETGEPIDVLYFGLLNPGLMPQINRVLCGLSVQSPIIVPNPATAYDRNGVRINRDAYVTPRLQLGSLVLQRRTWHFAGAAMPPRGVGDTREFFRVVRRWASDAGLPRQVFVRFSPSADAMKVAGTAEDDFDWENFNRAKLKPFYVDFDNPMLVRLFGKMLNSTRFDMSAQEVLPKLEDQCTMVNGQQHVSELQLEMTLPAGRGHDV